MAKKNAKNTLKDLTAFLKSEEEEAAGSGAQAAAPAKQEATDYLKAAPKSLVAPQKANLPKAEALSQELHQQLAAIATTQQVPVQKVLLQFVRESLEQLEEPTANDVMLLSTVYYLEHQTELQTLLEKGQP